MVSIGATGALFRQGDDGSTSRFDERPQFTSIFAHDFCIDSTEVTIAAYRRVMEKIPVQLNSAESIDTLQPVCFVTWFDAVLYCNRKSNIEGLDTVYAYGTADTTVKGNCYRLRGLDPKLDKAGYRLPTEAEWEYAAHAGTGGLYVWGDSPDSAHAQKHAWYSSNADGRAHPVGRLAENCYGLFDMAGNVMEWVHDAKGPFPAGPVTDFTGSATSLLDERPVKSGSWKQGIERLRIAGRSDDYETISSTATAYIGFRCASGVIKAGAFSFGGTADAEIPHVRIAAADLAGTLGLPLVKIVFVNKFERGQILCYTDFSVPDPRVIYFPDSNNVFSPVISPDGRWVAYTTRDDGAVGDARIYFRALSPDRLPPVGLPDEPAFCPRWWVDTVLSDTFIVYSGTGMRNSDPDWRTALTKKQMVRNGRPVGTPEVLARDGGYRDGLSKNGMYLASGFDRLLMKNLSTGERRTLFTGPGNGKGTNDTSQVCNVSISPGGDDPASVMLLDFGCRETSTVVGRPYGIHECIFIADFNNRVISWYPAPDGFLWSHPEWSTHPGYAAAGLENSDGLHSSIGTLDLGTGRFTEALAGRDLLFPHLWASEYPGLLVSDLAPDSAGYYNEPPSLPAQATLSWKLPLFWKYRNEMELFFVGSSRLFHGVVPADFTRYRAINLGANGADLQTALQLARNYILNHGSRTRLIGLELMIDWMDLERGDQSWTPGFSNTRGFVYDRNHDFWTDVLPEGFTSLVKLAPNYPSSVPDSAYGFFPFVPAAGWGGMNPSVRKGT